jgi:DNA-binding transcriptional LysR family regulator
MEPHLLRTFVAVCEAGSFSGAAERLGYTQSAVSQHIAALEADLGTPLLTRRPVAMTDAGQRLHEHAPLILLRLAAARADVTRAVVAPARLVLAGTPLAFTGPVVAALATVRRERPRLRAEVHVADRAAVVAGVATGGFDVGLVDGFAAPTDPLRLPDLGLPERAALAVAEQPAAIVLPAGHPLARRRSLHLTDLADAYWLDAPGIVGLADIRAAAMLDRLRSGLRYEGTDVTVLCGLSAAGSGLTMLPRSAAEGPGRAAVAVGLPRLLHRVELLRGPGRPTAAVARFVALVRPGGGEEGALA